MHPEAKVKEMLVTEELVTPNATTGKRRTAQTLGSVGTSAFNLIRSVRFGVVMLLLLFLCCLIGMFIMQQDLNGFREYYKDLTPSKRLVYGTLGFFDIYHSWYFTVLLAVTGLSILLASVYNFPKAWRFVRHPHHAASPRFITNLEFQAVIETGNSNEKQAEQIAASWRTLGFKPKVSRRDNEITLFAQRNVWNRFGAIATHLALIVIFVGGLLTSRYGVGGMVEISPGKSTNEIVNFEARLEGDQLNQMRLPFTVECTDLRQELINPGGGLEPMNTLDWLSYIKISDGGEVASGLVHLNEPFDYRGYRFFQSSFEPQGHARQITLSLEPTDGSPAREVTIARNETVSVDGIGEVSYSQFYPDFTVQQQQPATLSGEYKNPAVQLDVRFPDGNKKRTLAFNPSLATEFYGAVTEEMKDQLLINGNKAILKDFEKVAISHILRVQYDLGREPVYAGFILLLISLSGVFFFSHQRVWALIEPMGDGSKIYFGGDTNRYKAVFENRFDALVEAAVGKSERKR